MKSIPGYEGIYSITIDGRVYSHPRIITDSRGFQLNIPGGWRKEHKNMTYLFRNGNTKAIMTKTLIKMVFGDVERMKNINKFGDRPKVVING